jgi:hypothetical protein
VVRTPEEAGDVKYMMLIYGSDEQWEALSADERRAAYGRIEEWWRREAKAGRIVGGEELAPRRTGKVVRKRDGSVTVTDGPFVEAKETIGGFGLLEVPDEATAVQMARECPFRSVEIRRVVQEEERA